MRRVAHHLFTILSTISLLLFLTVAVFCARALMGFHDNVVYRSYQASAPALEFINAAEYAEMLAWDREHWLLEFRADRDSIVASGRQPFSVGYPKNSFEIHFYYWWVFPVTAVLPATFIVKQSRKRKWRIEGRCHICGYDLRASPERCPECGTVPTALKKD